MLLLIVVSSLPMVHYVAAENLVNPTSPPPGGQTAEPISTSAREQHKLGSVIIGPSGSATVTNPSVCLNTNSVDATSSLKCIKNWGDVGGVFNSSYVKLHQTDVANGAAALRQSGYVRLKGNNLSAYPITSRFAVYNGTKPSGAYTALYADGLTLDNNAGYFAGTLGIEPTVNNTPGRLCLNGTAAPGSSDGYYCISQWSEIATTISNKLTLQSLTGTPVNEQGNVGLGQAFNAAAFVIGDPVALGFNYTCGDGMCNAGETSTAGSKYCPIDCAAIKPLTGLTANQSGEDVILNVSTGAAQEPIGSPVTVLVVRSDVSTLGFKPMGGTTYARAGTTSFEIVGSRTCTSGVTTGCTLTDSTVDSSNSLIVGKTYFYSAWQGNAYPRYQMSGASTASVKITGPGSNPDEPPDDIPEILR